MTAKLGIIAGAGPLPGRLIAACRARGREAFVLAFEQHADPATVTPVPHAWVRIGAIGMALRILREQGVKEVVLAGSIGRPSLAELRPDARAIRFLAKGVLRGGDDALLRAVIDTLEREEGLRVIGAQELLGGDLVPAGALGALAPDDEAWADIRRGTTVLEALGAADIGQAVVVQQGIVLGVEAVEGTDALLDRCAGLRRGGQGGVLVKLLKPGQEQRADLPTIGRETVLRAAAAGLRGIAVGAATTLVVDRAATAAAADQAGLFVLGLSDEG